MVNILDFNDYLSVLNEEQKKAVCHEGKSLLILAGAGSGKTRVITTKIAYLISQKKISPSSILAVTFTKKAANEMRERAVALEKRAQYAQIRTFHSFGAYFLRLFYNAANLEKTFTVYDDDDVVNLITKAVPYLTKKQAAHYSHFISLAKDYCLLPEDSNLSSITEDFNFPDVYSLYQKKLRETGNVDFGDLILLPYLVLKNNPYIKKAVYNRYKVILVDEYQDSNVAQFKLLQELSGANENGGKGIGTYVCVVGDDDQSIYKFRGAEVQNILNFQNQFYGTDLIKLQTNYRSTSEILACADSVVKNNEGRLGKTLLSARGSGKKPTLVFLPNQDDETDFCSDLIEQSKAKGVPYSDWAILYRTNAQSLGFETSFMHRKIPYQVVGSLKFYEREEIKDAIAWISFVANPKDIVSFQRIVNKPSRGIGELTQNKIIDGALGKSILESTASLTKKAASGFNEFCSLVKEFNEMIPASKMTETLSLAQSALEVQALLSQGDSDEVVAADEKVLSVKNENSADEKATFVKNENFSDEDECADEDDDFDEDDFADEDDDSDEEDDFSDEDVTSLKNENSGENKNSTSEEKANLSAFVDAVIKKSGLEELHKMTDENIGTQKVENLQELVNSAAPYPCTQEGLLDFLDHINLDKSLETDEDNSTDKVTLITLHNTKGLEFSRVVITGMENGIFPREGKDESEIEEERRLFYVGITRAKDELYFTSCASRRLYGHTNFMSPSPFLNEINKKYLRILGDKPYSFSSSSSSASAGSASSNSASNPGDEWAKKFPVGASVFNDVYGEGQIVRHQYSQEGELVISVNFFSGGIKKFLPKFQSKSLIVEREV